MFLYFRIGVGSPVVSLRGSEIAIAVLMQIIYGINLVTLFFIIDALVRIYDGLLIKSQFFINAMDMILHTLASFVFIGTLVIQDLIDISKARLAAVVTPQPVAVFYLSCLASFVSQVCLIKTLQCHCESFKLVIEEEAYFKRIVAQH